MIGLARLGTNDLDRAKAFYGELFAIAQVDALTQTDSVSVWGTAGEPMFIIGKPFDGEPATAGNGVMIGLPLRDPEMVNDVHAKAIELGGKDEGAPGPRGTGGFHAAYLRDLDGNKLCIFHRGPA